MKVAVTIIWALSNWSIALGFTCTIYSDQIYSFRQGHPKSLQEFLARALLTIDPGNPFDPADPPSVFLLDDRRILTVQVAPFSIVRSARCYRCPENPVKE